MKNRMRITIKERDRTISLLSDDVMHITCSGYISTVHTTDRKIYRSSKLLKQYEEELTDDGFVRINHSTLINFSTVKNVKIEKNRRLLLNDEQEFIISRSKIYKVRKLIK